MAKILPTTKISSKIGANVPKIFPTVEISRNLVVERLPDG